MIGPDGRISLGAAGRLRVEGQPITEVTHRVAEFLGVPEGWVGVRVAEYNSQQIFLSGQVVGLQRAVPYQGPETILDLLRRAGGLTPGAAPEDVYVVRARIGEGRQPEVFRVDLKAILFRHDGRTNIVVQPLDQVFVGETCQFSLEKCFPPWLRPVYDALCGLKRPPGAEDKPARPADKEL
jgi:protein involved in polysaccharide export with SLBB domain